MRAAVITGDIVGSSDLVAGDLDASFSALADAAADFGKVHGSDLKFTRYRGDGWQVLVAPASLLFEAALFLIARLRAAAPDIRTRLAIAVGDVADAGDDGSLARASGSAFTRSGRALDEMPARRKIALAGLDAPFAPAVIDLCEFVTDGWTQSQAEAVALSLDPARPTQERVAGTLGISRQAVQLRLSGAGFSHFAAAREAFGRHTFVETGPRGTDDG